MQAFRRATLALSIALSFYALCARGAEAAGAPGRRLATFACDVTTPLGSTIYGHEVTTIEHRLSAKGVVLDDGGRRYVLCALDWRSVSRAINSLFRSKLAEAAGTTPAQVAVQCIHQHTAPSGGEAGDEFVDEVADRLAAAAREAVDRLEPFDRIGTGQAKVDRVASTRRIPTGDGKVITRFTSTKGKPHLREMPEGYIDPFLKTITFASGDAPLVRLHYYATHPQSFYLDGRISIDFPGMARERLEEEEGVFQIYFTGCGGDIGAGKYNDGSREARDGLAERLYAAMAASAASTRFVPAGPIRWRTTTVSLPAKKKEKKAEKGEKGREKEEAVAQQQKRPQGSIGPIEMSSLQMGDVRILHLPGEPMVHFQHYAQELARDQLVAVAGYGDGSAGYICTAKAFEEGGYEPRASRLAPPAQGVLEAAIRRLLGLE